MGSSLIQNIKCFVKFLERNQEIKLCYTLRGGPVSFGKFNICSPCCVNIPNGTYCANCGTKWVEVTVSGSSNYRNGVYLIPSCAIPIDMNNAIVLSGWFGVSVAVGYTVVNNVITFGVSISDITNTTSKLSSFQKNTPDFCSDILLNNSNLTGGLSDSSISISIRMVDNNVPQICGNYSCGTFTASFSGFTNQTGYNNISFPVTASCFETNKDILRIQGGINLGFFCDGSSASTLFPSVSSPLISLDLYVRPIENPDKYYIWGYLYYGGGNFGNSYQEIGYGFFSYSDTSASMIFSAYSEQFFHLFPPEQNIVVTIAGI